MGGWERKFVFNKFQNLNKIYIWGAGTNCLELIIMVKLNTWLMRCINGSNRMANSVNHDQKTSTGTVCSEFFAVSFKDTCLKILWLHSRAVTICQ